MWLSLIWTKWSSPFVAVIFWPKACDVSTPPTVQMTPVPGPGHTLQKAAAVNAVFIVILNNYFRQVSPHVDLFELPYGVPYSDQPVFIPPGPQEFQGISMSAGQYPSV